MEEKNQNNYKSKLSVYTTEQLYKEGIIKNPLFDLLYTGGTSFEERRDFLISSTPVSLKNGYNLDDTYARKLLEEHNINAFSRPNDLIKRVISENNYEKRCEKFRSIIKSCKDAKEVCTKYGISYYTLTQYGIVFKFYITAWNKEIHGEGGFKTMYGRKNEYTIQRVKVKINEYLLKIFDMVYYYNPNFSGSIRLDFELENIKKFLKMLNLDDSIIELVDSNIVNAFFRNKFPEDFHSEVISTRDKDIKERIFLVNHVSNMVNQFKRFVSDFYFNDNTEKTSSQDIINTFISNQNVKKPSDLEKCIKYIYPEYTNEMVYKIPNLTQTNQKGYFKNFLKIYKEELEEESTVKEPVVETAVNDIKEETPLEKEEKKEVSNTTISTKKPEPLPVKNKIRISIVNNHDFQKEIKQVDEEQEKKEKEELDIELSSCLDSLNRDAINDVLSIIDDSIKKCLDNDLTFQIKVTRRKV